MDMDTGHFLTDVLENAIERARRQLRGKKPSEMQGSIKPMILIQVREAGNYIIGGTAKELHDLLRRNEDSIVEMVRENLETGQPVQRRWAADVSKAEWQEALKRDEANLVGIQGAIETLEAGGKVKNLTLPEAKTVEKGLKEVIQNKKQMISKLAVGNPRLAFEQALVGTKESSYRAHYRGDPRWITAKYPGFSDDGEPFNRGDKVLYWPQSKTFMVGKKAEEAWRKFESEAADEGMYNYAMEKEAFVFPSQEALDKYMKEHPKANPRHHTVRTEEEEKARGEEARKSREKEKQERTDQKKKQEEDREKSKTPWGKVKQFFKDLAPDEGAGLLQDLAKGRATRNVTMLKNVLTPPKAASMNPRTAFEQALALNEGRGLGPGKGQGPYRGTGEGPGTGECEREAVAPPEWEETVKKMKKHPEIDNPWAISWWMKNRGYTPGGKEADMNPRKAFEQALNPRKAFEQALKGEIPKIGSADIRGEIKTSLEIRYTPDVVPWSEYRRGIRQKDAYVVGLGGELHTDPAVTVPVIKFAAAIVAKLNSDDPQKATEARFFSWEELRVEPPAFEILLKNVIAREQEKLMKIVLHYIKMKTR